MYQVLCRHTVYIVLNKIDKYNWQGKGTKRQITDSSYITNCRMFRFGGMQTFKKSAVKEWEGLFAVMTFKLGKDLVIGSVARNVWQAEGISWVAALRWIRACQTEKLKWAGAAGTRARCPWGTLKALRRNLDFIHCSMGSLRIVCKVKVTTAFMF